MPRLTTRMTPPDVRETLGRRYGDTGETLGRQFETRINNWRGNVLGMIHDRYTLSQWEGRELSRHFSYAVCSCPAAKIARFQEICIPFTHWTRLENWI